jgi:hypothetical protein
MKEGKRAVGRMRGAKASAVSILSAGVQHPHTILRASYSTLLSSRIARNSLKTLIGGAFYPSLKPGVFGTHIATVERHSC